MYKRFILVLLFVVMSIGLANASTMPMEAQTPINGFRGIKWGDPASKYENELSVLYDSLYNSKSTTYIRPYENPYIGGAYIGHFEYSFDEKGFYQAIAMIDYTPHRENKRLGENAPKSYSDLKNRFLKIYNACVKQWGQPSKEVIPMRGGEYSSEYKWYTLLEDMKLDDGLCDIAIAELVIIYNTEKKPFAVCLDIYTLDGEQRQETAREKFRENRNREF